MATRVKKQTMAPKEVASSQTSDMKTESIPDSPSKSSMAKLQNGPGIAKKMGKKGPKKIVTKTVQMKAKAKAKRTALKINPKNLARVLIENGKGIEAKKILLKSNLKEVKTGRKPKALKKVKSEDPPVLEPIFPQEENVEVKKTPRKRGKKPKIPDLIAIKSIKSEIKEEPIDEALDLPVEVESDLPMAIDQSPKTVARKVGRPRKLKPDTSIEEVMNDLSFLIKADDIRNDARDVLDSNKTDVTRTKKMTKKQRFDLFKRDLLKKENIENTLSKLDPADTKIIDRLDLNVRRIKSTTPLIKRRHSIEKFSISSVDATTEALLPQLSAFSNLPRCLSPRTSKKNRMGLKKPSPYATRSDSPARILRNGKHRRLKDLTLFDGLEDVKRRKRPHSDLSGSETASKLSGYDSDSSFSDLASLHGSEKDSDIQKTNIRDTSNLSIEESSNSESKLQSNSTPIIDLREETETHLIDTNSNVYRNLNEPIDINLNSKKDTTFDATPEKDTPSAKVPEKGFILDSMKQIFNEVIDANESDTSEIETGSSINNREKEIQPLVDEEILETGITSAEKALEKVLEQTVVEVEENDELESHKNTAPSEDFGSEDKEAEEQASFENIVQGCIDSIGNISPDIPVLTPAEEPHIEKDVVMSESEKDDSLPIIENMMIERDYPPNSDTLDNLEPPHLESSVPAENIPTQVLTNNNGSKLGIAVTEKDNVVSFSIEHIADDVEEHDQSNEDLIQSLEEEEVPNKIVEEEIAIETTVEPMITNEIEEIHEQEPEPEPELTISEEAVNVEDTSVTNHMEIDQEPKLDDNSKENDTMEVVEEQQEGGKMTENDQNDCDNKSTETENQVLDANNETHVDNESPEEIEQKESILKALGLQSLRAAKEAKQEEKAIDRPSTSTGRTENFTETWKTVIKINKKKGKNSVKMTLQKNKSKGESNANAGEGQKVTKEGASTSWKHSKDSSDAGAHRKSHYSNRSNMDGSSEHTSDGEVEKAGQEKSLVIPEKASSFSIHPGRLCKDECSYCFGKFGLFDTPCHIAQIKSVDRQNKILASEKHLTRDSCLCDACYRHVDRKSNSPSYINKSLKRNSLIAPGPRQNHCHVLGCNNVSNNILRRKWIIKMRKSICQAINIDLDNPGLHSIPICDEHFAALEHLMVCAMCKRRLAKNHIHYLGPEVKELNNALKDEEISICLPDKPVVCKLCKCFASIILKDPEERADNSVNFFTEYKKRLLHFNDIVPMDAAAAEGPIVVPSKSEKSSDKRECDKDGRRKKRMRNSSNETVTSGKDGQEDKTTEDSEEGLTDRATDNKNSSGDNQSRSQSPEEGDEYSTIDYNTLIPAIALECPSDNESKKELSKSCIGLQKRIARLELMGSAVEISKTTKSRSDANKYNDLAAQKLGQNPSITLKPNYSMLENDQDGWNKAQNNLISNPAISVRQLFPGEEDLALSGNIDFNNPIERTPEGWEKCVTTIQYDEETKLLWQELQKPYGSKSSFLRHLVLLEKYFRNGDLVLSQNASHHAVNYSESVHNRLRAYDNIPSSSGNIQPISMIPFNKMNKSNSSIGSSTIQSGGIPPVTISQIGRENETMTSSKTPITLQQLNQPPLFTTVTSLPSFVTKNKSSGAPPGLISLHAAGSARPILPVKSQPQSQKFKFPITKNWRPNLIPIDPNKKTESKTGLVQVISSGKPYHITLEDYKKMCAIKRSFEAKQKKKQEQQLLKTQPQSLLLTHASVLKTVVPKKGLIISKTSGGTVSETKHINILPGGTTLSASGDADCSETILKKLDKQVERLGQSADGSAKMITLDKKGAVQILPRIPKSLTVIPQTVRKSSRPPGPVLYITPKNGVPNSNGTSTNKP